MVCHDSRQRAVSSYSNRYLDQVSTNNVLCQRLTTLQPVDQYWCPITGEISRIGNLFFLQFIIDKDEPGK